MKSIYDYSIFKFCLPFSIPKKKTNVCPKRKGSVSYPYTGPDSPLSLQKVEAPRISRQWHIKLPRLLAPEEVHWFGKFNCQTQMNRGLPILSSEDKYFCCTDRVLFGHSTETCTLQNPIYLNSFVWFTQNITWTEKKSLFAH